MFQYYLYHGTLIPLFNRIGHKNFLEIESNAFSKSINRDGGGGVGSGWGVNVMGGWVILKKGLQIVLPAFMALPLPQQQQQLCAVERLTVSLTSSNLRH